MMLFKTLLALCAPAASWAKGLTYRGVDWSSVAVEEKAGIRYKSSNNVAQPLEKILVDNGVNIVRQRVWVNPADGNYNLDYNIALAKRARAVGMDVYIDLHFSDTWADPAHQKIPAGWPTDVDNLAWRVYNYTLDVSNQLAAAGINPRIMSIGNEITAGMLFPTGSTSNFYNLARILHSASSGIKDSRLSTKPRIMIHLDNGWKWDTQKWWYENVLKQGPLVTSDFDMMGVSYYPFYNSDATLANLKTSLANMARTWNKEIVVAEINWPTSCPSPKYPFPRDLNMPISASGQVDFVRRVADAVSAVKNGVGLFYWEPAWVDNAALGSSCASNTMFAWPGVALTSLSVFSGI